MINCAIYPRKSKQIDNSDSMEAQMDMCISYLDSKYGKNNYTYTLYDADYGITGHSIKKRKDFQRMMNDVKSKKIQLVVIQRYDRIARNTRDFCNLYHDMEINDCNLVSVSQQIDTTTPYGKKFMYDQASMAELEWALCSERRKDANKYAAKIGKCTMPNKSLPYGYTTKTIDGIRRMVIDESKKDIVLDIFDHYKTYYNYTATARYVNDKYGLHKETNNIKNMINNTCFMGEYRGNTSYCEPYVTREYFESIQNKKPVIKMKNEKGLDIYYTGMIRCPVCGRKMRGYSQLKQSGKRYGYYHCEYSTSGLCENKKVKSENLIEGMVIDYIKSVVGGAVPDVDVEEKKKKIVDNTDQLKAELERLNKMYQKGRIDDKYYDSEYFRLNELIAINEANTKPQCKNTINLPSDWLEVYNSLDRIHKKLFYRDIIDSLVFNKDMQLEHIIFL